MTERTYSFTTSKFQTKAADVEELTHIFAPFSLRWPVIYIIYYKIYETEMQPALNLPNYFPTRS
jgi:hypothetical protein